MTSTDAADTASTATPRSTASRAAATWPWADGDTTVR
jgi:hypothetical protein